LDTVWCTPEETPEEPQLHHLEPAEELPELQVISRQQLAKVAGQDAEIFAVFAAPDNTANHSPSDLPTHIRRLLQEFQDVFPDNLPDGLPPQRIVDHEIKLEPGSTPPYGTIYRLSYPEQEELNKQMAELIKKGFIQPSTSPYGAPVLFVHKKDGTL
jgi:hypothetical protein